MDRKLLEIHEFNGFGYKPLIDYGAWRVAILRYIDELIPERIEQVERHNETDEVFVLLAGQAVLFMGEGETNVVELHTQVMEPGKLYNVKRGAWHTVVMSRDTSILLVENFDTSSKNSDYAPLSKDLRRVIIETAAREQPDWWGNEG
jgi:ureidoglycolate hydrolase